MATAAERRDRLTAVAGDASACIRCPQLVACRTQVVFGSGSPDADVLFVGEAPGNTGDEQGFPLAGRAGELLFELLAEIGLQRDAVYVTTVVKCHPPANRDPLPQEVANCQDYLHRQVEEIRPKVVCPLGGYATKLLRGDAASIRRVRGQPEVRVLGTRAVRVLPLFHPAAALYTRPLLDVLREDVSRIPELLALEPPEQPAPASPPPAPEPDPPPDGQLGLF